jgi:hypothetical protein
LDEIINVIEEEERCGRYGFGYLNRTSRRHVFMGALIADDPWDTLMAIAAEAYGIYHTVAFIKSNTTQSYFPRELRFYPRSSNLARLQRGDLFGPDAQAGTFFGHYKFVMCQNSVQIKIAWRPTSLVPQLYLRAHRNAS